MCVRFARYSFWNVSYICTQYVIWYNALIGISFNVSNYCKNMIYIVYLYTGCPTRYRTRHLFNNFTTNEDIATKFDTQYRHTLQTRTTDTHYRHALQTSTTDTHYRHTLQTHSSSFLTQRTYSCSNFVAISSFVLELLKKCRVR